MRSLPQTLQVLVPEVLKRLPEGGQWASDVEGPRRGQLALVSLPWSQFVDARSKGIRNRVTAR